MSMRLMLDHELAGLIVIHVDDILFAGKNEVGRVIAEDLINGHIPAKESWKTVVVYGQ